MVLASILASILALQATGEASMNGQVIPGDILDPRITSCGVRIDGDRIAALRPFIETADDLSGAFKINVTKRSKSGTSMTSQGSAFKAGTLGATTVGVDRPSTVLIDMTVTETDGAPLCRLQREVDLGDGVIEL